MRTTSPRLDVSLGKTWLGGPLELRTANMKLVPWQLERIMVEVLVFGIVTPVPSQQKWIESTVWTRHSNRVTILQLC